MAGFGVLTVVVVLVAFARAGFPPRWAYDESGRPDANDSDRSGPTDTPYPPGSRPAGPGAEGMNVAEAGEIIPGPREHPRRKDQA